MDKNEWHLVYTVFIKQKHQITNCQYAFARNYNGQSVIVIVNNSDNDAVMNLPVQNAEEYTGGLNGEKVSAKDGCMSVNVKANSGEIWLPVFN